MMNKSLAERTIAGNMIIFALLVTCGCSGELRTEYGASRGVEGDQSISGFGVLRRTYKNSGWSTSDVKRLNERLEKTNAIIWIPDTRDALYGNAIEWLEDWLAQDERTLIYLVPDGGCESQYFVDAHAFSKLEQRIEYRRRLARLQTDRLFQRLRNESIPENGWFSLDHVSEGVLIDKASGEWQINNQPPRNAKEYPQTTGNLGITFKILPPVHSNAPPTSAPPTSAPPMYGMSQGTSTAQMMQETLLAATDGSAIVTRITADQWGSSKIIVVGNASLLCNYSLSTPLGQSIAEKLIEETSMVPGLVGFMSTGALGAMISDIDPEINAVTGMELFTVWPLSLVMLHLAVIGFVACMILLPIFGRPREDEGKTASDFRDHLDAVASLMHRSGGEEFARRRVSDYMRRIRGDVVGDWIMPETTSTATKENSIPSINPETSNKKEAL